MAGAGGVRESGDIASAQRIIANAQQDQLKLRGTPAIETPPDSN
jgi:hypothetical protein